MGGKDDSELVAPDPRDQIAKTCHSLELCGERPQGFVPDPMSVHVVDQFQFVHVDDHDPGWVAVIACQRNGEVELRIKHGAVGQPCYASICNAETSTCITAACRWPSRTNAEIRT